ncbi:hypothetical protein SS1G_06978 [Sclerotinia sclerotiorum 1980 UF-70]|uniref:Uncharacterized protein n=1 Tax=Sclerotinia sclerotiorum (strain ATCC 18683 / 1980 / Ss-1) TaxID=665079 RepID=A7ENS9_SCLS1|nr:hypothetical protein SS1G_06978 [Sclerotinia sclerotiorum 1980 UF-70]EDO04495.1 hypothetical protein SS1G_06978 [Sclerotinia sclerotiorum 1980 UF-70]
MDGTRVFFHFSDALLVLQSSNSYSQTTLLGFYSWAFSTVMYGLLSCLLVLCCFITTYSSLSVSLRGCIFLYLGYSFFFILYFLLFLSLVYSLV